MRVKNPPSAGALMATARSFGNYDLAAALADLVDNSIEAEARNVWISFEPHQNDVTVRVRDDGHGMSGEELKKAMRPASGHPDQERHRDALGRFGWGLKSASLSQARVLTTVSWTAAEFSAARWDIDDLDDWTMDFFEGSSARELITDPPLTPTGTEVIWTRCDRLWDAGLHASLDERLNEKIAHARRQLSVTFHRFLAGEGRLPLSIHLQGTPLQAVDPFMTSHTATQTLDQERIQVKGSASITVKPFVLPHFSKLSVQERDLLGGEEGLVRNQGFYIYRNLRLIVHGTWFRLMPHSELSQLTRVRVDLPNSLDAEWKITLDKSDAQLPVVLRKRLKDIVQRFSKRSVGVQRRRGVDLNTVEKAPVWRRNAHHGRIRYLVNREHPVIQELISGAENTFVASEAIRLLEACIPIEYIAQDTRGEHGDIVQAITDPAEFDSLIQACMLAYVRQADGRPTLAGFLAFAKRVEPFSEQWKYTESAVREKAVKEWNLK